MFTEPIHGVTSAFDLHFKVSFCTDDEQLVKIKSEIINAALKSSSTPSSSDDDDHPTADTSDDVDEEPPCKKCKVDPDVDFWASWDALHAQSQSRVTQTSSS